MSITTPPGWYPDPGQAIQGPALERFWDGSTWTDYTREPQGAVASQIPPSHHGFGPPQPSGQFFTPGTGMPAWTPLPPEGGSRGKTYMIVGAAAVLVAAIITGIVTLNGGDDGPDQAGPRPTPTAGQPDDQGGNGGNDGGDGGGGGDSAPGTPDPGPDTDAAPDVVNGITVPVLAGWQSARSGSGGAAVTIGPYPCPADPKTECVRGGAFSRPATGYDAKTAKGVAKEDIPKNAEDSYGKDPKTGKEMYGGVTSHRQMKAGEVTVAGQKGYMIRWRVGTKKGDDGYVQSLVFPSPKDKDRFVVVRFGFDVNEKAPPLTDMDRITEGIEVLENGGDANDAAA
ncbi:DUF2510 domain-containing protein [Streptomyces sp. NPDC047108]|uniref:DUF2510 domain-containing protein n=1 Tax=Streptomyces sp. NPDC047108 TaxID=3155025 RepID=UPI0033D99A5D